MGIRDLRPTGCMEWCILFWLSPFILLWQAFKIYVLGCMGVYVSQAATNVFCGLCICCGCWLYTDKKFPPNDASLGSFGSHAKGSSITVEWRRLEELFDKLNAGGAAAAPSQQKAGKRSVHLFHGKIEPDDIKQGSVGDCWLMACLQSLARHPAMITSLLSTRTYNAYGRYVVRLFDPTKNSWVNVVVSDHIPVDASTNRPLFAAPNDSEAWVLLLEKACAKMLGSYAALDGNNPGVGLAMLTGQPVLSFGSKDEGATWIKQDIVFHDKRLGEAVYQWNTQRAERFSADKLFEMLLAYMRRDALAVCHRPGSDDDVGAMGLIHGHAYSILDAKKVGDVRLLRLRNPWSRGGYTGRWCEGAPAWQQFPAIANACRDSDHAQAGAFWIAYEEFVEFFGPGHVDVCSRDTGFNDLRLDVHEEHGCCGPCLGCLLGCGAFWCGCQGCGALLCHGHKGSTATVSTATGCCSGVACCDATNQVAPGNGDEEAPRYKTSAFIAS